MKIIGTITTYVGTEHPGCTGARVRICAVLRGGARPEADVDADDYFVDNEETLMRLGGVTENDRLDVVPVREDGTLSFVHFDPRAIDVAGFAFLNIDCN